MSEEHDSEPSNGRPYFNEWEAGFSGELEDEWRQVTAAYSSQEGTPEWENPAFETANSPSLIPLPIQREEWIPRVRRVIAHCQQIAYPTALRILIDSESELPVFSAKERVRHLLGEFEGLLESAQTEAATLEMEALGEDEFHSELAASEVGQDLALTEVLAAEAAHAARESEAQSLLATALPVNMSLLGAGAGLKNILPALTQSNSKLVRALFRTGGNAGNGGSLARQALGLVPTIQRRVLSGLKAAQGKGLGLTPNLANRLFAAQTAKVLATPAIIGKALVRNQAIRNATMPPCPR